MMILRNNKIGILFWVVNSERFWVLICVWILVLEIIKVNNLYDLIYSC
jgi:hypothetical protein